MADDGTYVPDPEVALVPLLSAADVETCRAFGIPRVLMRAIAHGESGTGFSFWARFRGSDARIQFSRAVLSIDNLWVTLLDAYDPEAGDNEMCAVDVRIVDLLTVTMNRADLFTITGSE